MFELEFWNEIEMARERKMATQESKPEPKDYRKTADVQDRPTKSTKEESNTLLKLQEKWNNRHKDDSDAASKENLELFKKVARARKLYLEIRDEVAGIELDHEDIEEYQNLRTLAYSEYMALFEELISEIREELN